MRYQAILFSLLITSLGAGCSYVSMPSMPWSSDEVQSDPTAEALFNEGVKYLKNKRYALAIDRFERVKTEFPFAPQVIPAELKIAEAYYLDEEYPQAAAAFKDFQALHPTNENIPFVIYHLGLVHFEQFTSIDRDQKMTEIAKGHFETFVRNYPSSPYAGKAREKLAQCLEYLAEHEFDIASFYLRQKKYPAARDRFEEIVRRYPDTPAGIKSLYHLGESYRLEKNNVKAALAYEALIQHYPESPLAEKAGTQLGLLEKDKQDPLAMLLMRDPRPRYATGDIENPKSEKQNRKDIKLVAKKEVVHEEPGDEKGMFRSVIDTLNPFAPSSENGKKKKTEIAKKEGSAKEEPAKEESDGFFGSLWNGLNPFASDEKTEVETQQDPGLIVKVDKSLKEKGVDSQTPKPPAPELPKIADPENEPIPSPEETAKMLGKVDATLQQKGMGADDLPPLPEIAPALLASPSSREIEQQKVKARQSTATSELITGIDKTLEQKGMELPDLETPVGSKSVGSDPQGSGQERPASTPSAKVKLDSKLELEQGPLYLGGGEYKVQEKPKENKVEEPAQGTDKPGELPEAVVKGPPQPKKEKPSDETKSKPLAEGEEEEKGAFDQIKEDIESVGKVLNPFSW